MQTESRYFVVYFSREFIPYKSQYINTVPTRLGGEKMAEYKNKEKYSKTLVSLEGGQQST